MRFLVAIAGVQLASNLLLGTASLASNPHLERRIKAMLGEHATSYYRTGKFATPNNYTHLMNPNYDSLVKTEAGQSRMTLYLLPKKGIVSRYRHSLEFPSYAAVLYFDASAKRLMSTGCRTLSTKRYKIQSPMTCNEPGLVKVYALEGKWPTEEDIEREVMQKQIIEAVGAFMTIGAIVLYIIGFIKYSWVRQLTFIILGIVLCFVWVFVVIMSINYDIMRQ